MTAEVTPQERVQIFDLISSYSYSWDGRDMPAWVGLFTEGGSLSAAFQGVDAWQYESNAERAAFIREFYAGPGSDLAGMRHFQTNTILEKLADGAIGARTMFAVVVQPKGAPSPTLANTGVYVDRFVATASGWRFAARRILVDQPLPTAT
jgi:hypothetical protein